MQAHRVLLVLVVVFEVRARGEPTGRDELPLVRYNRHAIDGYPNKRGRAGARPYRSALSSASSSSRCVAESGINGGRTGSHPRSSGESAKIDFNAGMTGYFRRALPWR